MVGILVHGDNHFILGPSPMKLQRLRWRAIGPSYKSVIRNRFLSSDGRFARKSFERTWSGPSSFPVKEKLLRQFRGCSQNYPREALPFADTARLASETLKSPSKS
jgi:hypothetical protein